MSKPKTLQEAIRYFSDTQTCIETVAGLRWSDGVECVACGKKEHYWLKTQRRWKCKDCGKQFSVKVGTIFEDSPIGLDKWLAAMWLLANCKNGISSYEVARDLGVTQKTAWFMLHRIRLAMNSGWNKKLSGEVEADETFIGGKLRNMHKDKRKRAAGGKRGAVGKTVVVGLLERGGHVRATTVPDRSYKIVQANVKANVEYGSQLITDEAAAYYGLDNEFVHQVINHMERYVDGKVHTNGIENFWSLLKRGLSGTYVSVEPFHLDRYVDEQVFRFNNRGGRRNGKVTDGQRFELALSQVAGKRLTFAEVTGKVGQAAA